MARNVADAVASWGIRDPAVLGALRAVPREKFVPVDQVAAAYDNRPLPIGHGQTISQPYIVGLMTSALDLRPRDRVLEVGTGSGYQAAVLAELVDHVFTIEIILELATRAAATLAVLGYENVTVRHGDGYVGWREKAPFDGIVVTAAPDHVPRRLCEQLVDGGRLVIPVGASGCYQELQLIERCGDDFKVTSLGGVQFVPLTRKRR
ncbi:MAG: protein-L-isoaspartate(D-aspartate) O-methyltransferase [Anaerolineae bacterium]